MQTFSGTDISDILHGIFIGLKPHKPFCFTFIFKCLFMCLLLTWWKLQTNKMHWSGIFCVCDLHEKMNRQQLWWASSTRTACRDLSTLLVTKNWQLCFFSFCQAEFNIGITCCSADKRLVGGPSQALWHRLALFTVRHPIIIIWTYCIVVCTWMVVLPNILSYCPPALFHTHTHTHTYTHTHTHTLSLSLTSYYYKKGLVGIL